MKKNIFYLIMAILIFASCDEKEDYTQINSSVVEVAGEWWVNYVDGEYESGYTKLITFNTAADNGQEFWISDEHNFWAYKVKCPVNTANLTFSGTDLPNNEYDVDIQILDGKIIEDGALSTSGVVTDSIYFQVEFGDEPGVIYTASGWRKTGFLEDEH